MRSGTARVIDLAGEAAADAARLRRLFETMVTIRTVEERLLALFAEGRLRGTVHTCLGQEAIAAGVVAALDPARDAVCSNHRGHGHYLAYCGDVRGLIAEIMGRPDGVCGGIGGSQHLHRGNFYSNGILGGMAPVAAGIAMAEKAKGSGAVTVVFHGDGAMAEGIVAETLNIAALWRLPVLFAIEANRYAQSTAIAVEIAGRLAGRGEAVGMAVREVDGNDALAVSRAAEECVARLRAGDGPAMLVLDTYRLGPHSKGDDDRDPDEIAARRADCPIARARAALDAAWCAATEARVAAEIGAVVESLKDAP